MAGMSANTIVKKMVGGFLFKECNGGRPAYYVRDAKGNCLRVSYKDAQQVIALPQVEPCEPGLFEGYPQSWVINKKRGKP